MRIVSLDILRFSAASLVMAYHYVLEFGESESLIRGFLEFGYLGVPLFFIISGFVISASAERRDPFRFAISRAVRLVPAYWFGVLFTALILYLSSDSVISVSRLLWNMTFINEYIGVSSIDGVYWTLHAEIKFYGCVFLLLLFGVYRFHRVWLSVWLLAALSYRFFGEPFFLGWFISPSYSPFFISGVVFYLIYTGGINTFNVVIFIVSLLLSCDRALFQANDFIPDMKLIDGLVSVGIIFIINIMLLLISLGKMKVRDRFAYRTLGGITYPLYLLHNEAGKVLIGELSPLFGAPLSIIFISLIIIMTSYLVYVFVEPVGAKYLRDVLVRSVDGIRLWLARCFGESRLKKPPS